MIILTLQDNISLYFLLLAKKYSSGLSFIPKTVLPYLKYIISLEFSLGDSTPAV